jgi:hypothetical protein
MQSERLYQDAARLSVQAEKLPDGAEREELVRLARQAEQRTSGFLQRPRGFAMSQKLAAPMIIPSDGTHVGPAAPES